MDEHKKEKLKKTFKVNDTRRITDEMIYDKLYDVAKDKEVAEALWENNENNFKIITSSIDMLKHSLDVTEENNKKENQALYYACYGLLNELSIELRKEDLTIEQKEKYFQIWFDVIKKIEDNNLLNKKYRLKLWNNVMAGVAIVIGIGTGIAYKTGALKKFFNNEDDLGIGEDDIGKLGDNNL
ncbi:MAG: hypothetical protein II411_06710 [Lachnospiraceae bacterium]|nr:hypothetical protein [Lachnospiraceae bacterium]